MKSLYSFIILLAFALYEKFKKALKKVADIEPDELDK